MHFSSIPDKLAASSRSSFRSRFHLHEKERKMIQDKGLETIRKHAYELLETRLFPAQPPNDGKQTPFKGHPVFIAQHATATCCRSCLEKWHKIPKGQELTPDQKEYVVKLLLLWIEKDDGR